MSYIHDQKGIGHVVLPLLVLVLAVVGFSGYEVFHAHKTTTPTTTVSSTSSTPPSVPATIKSSSDLKQAADALNVSSEQMQSQLNSTSLDSSINQML